MLGMSAFVVLIVVLAYVLAYDIPDAARAIISCTWILIGLMVVFVVPNWMLLSSSMNPIMEPLVLISVGSYCMSFLSMIYSGELSNYTTSHLTEII